MTVGLSTLSSGAKKIQDGQSQLIDKVEKIASQATELINGLNDAIEGLDKLDGGMDSVNSYLGGLRDYAGSKPIFYIPADQIHSTDFTKSMDNYMSIDRTITKVIVILSVDPYSQKAMDIVNNVSHKVESNLDNSSLQVSEWGISGATQTNIDLRTMSNKDFSLARIIMLLGIFIVLIVITKDIWMPTFVMSSLVASYYIAISMSHLIFKYLLNMGDPSCYVPFVSFIMIVSLGVDYSIFLIMRYKEIEDTDQSESIVIACRKIGAIIASAAFILAGTFAALYPSGVLTLMEISVTVIIGIALLSLVFVPVFIPTMISLKSKLFK